MKYCMNTNIKNEINDTIDPIDLLSVYNMHEIYSGIIFVNGNGVLSPSECDIACLVGLHFNTPTIGYSTYFDDIEGVDKNKLLTEFTEKCNKMGDYIYIKDDNDKVYGAALFVNNKMKPLYISIGHRTSLLTAIKIILLYLHP